MRGRFAPYILGAGLLGIAVVMVIFTLFAAFFEDPWAGFLLTAILSAALGRSLTWWGTPDAEPTRREALVGVMLLWFVVPVMGAVPFMVDADFSLVAWGLSCCLLRCFPSLPLRVGNSFLLKPPALPKNASPLGSKTPLAPCYSCMSV